MERPVTTSVIRSLRSYRQAAGIALLLLGVTSLSACATTSKQVAPDSHPKRVTFSLPTLDGALVRPEDHAGEVLLVDMWATWCVPCAESMPFYADLHQRYAAQGFRVIAVSVDEDADAVRRFVEARDLPFQVVLDPGGLLPEQVGMATMPSFVLVGRSGHVAYLHAGYSPADNADIEARVVAALAEERAEPAPAPVPAADEGSNP